MTAEQLLEECQKLLRASEFSSCMTFANGHAHYLFEKAKIDLVENARLGILGVHYYFGKNSLRSLSADPLIVVKQVCECLKDLMPGFIVSCEDLTTGLERCSYITISYPQK